MDNKKENIILEILRKFSYAHQRHYDKDLYEKPETFPLYKEDLFNQMKYLLREIFQREPTEGEIMEACCWQWVESFVENKECPWPR